jgi:SAM-dependent methyltransferase
MLQATVSLHKDTAGFAGDLRCSEDALPFESETIALAYLLHSLECADDPHALVRECARVLQPEGVMFVVLLSTTSLWRVRWARKSLRPMSERKTRQLLHDAGLEVDYGIGLGPVWPRQISARSADNYAPGSRWVPDPLRACLLLVARKRRAGMMPLGLRKSPVAMGSHAHAG